MGELSFMRVYAYLTEAWYLNKNNFCSAGSIST